MSAPLPREGRASGRARTPVRLVVNPIACDAHELCAELAPELIGLDDWGYPIVDGRLLEGELLEHARRAVAACPVMALHLRAT